MESGTRQPRRYSSALRAEQAARTRQRILDAAADCFAGSGYPGTTLAAIAAAAGVSVETVQANGPKATLFMAAIERRFAGDEGQHSILDRPDVQELIKITDLDRFIAAVVGYVSGANRRTHALWRAFNAAADTDAAVKAWKDDLWVRRHRDVEQVLHGLIERGAAPAGDPAARVYTLSFVLGPEAYGHFVVDAGWSGLAYEAWVERAIRHLVL